MAQFTRLPTPHTQPRRHALAAAVRPQGGDERTRNREKGFRRKGGEEEQEQARSIGACPPLLLPRSASVCHCANFTLRRDALLFFPFVILQLTTRRQARMMRPRSPPPSEDRAAPPRRRLRRSRCEDPGWPRFHCASSAASLLFALLTLSHLLAPLFLLSSSASSSSSWPQSASLASSQRCLSSTLLHSLGVVPTTRADSLPPLRLERNAWQGTGGKTNCASKRSKGRRHAQFRADPEQCLSLRA